MDKWQALLERFLKDECTPEENRLIFHAIRNGWIDEPLQDAIERVIVDFDENNITVPLENPELLLQEIRSKIKNKQKKPVKKIFIREFLKIASVIVLTLLCVGLYNLIGRMEESREVVFNTITVPPGQTVNMTLADGTKIWLNANTELKYPALFNRDRKVILNGEAYFEVTKQDNKPFIVHTNEYEVEVLGTSFDVEAYNTSKSNFRVSLLEGSVKVTSVHERENTVMLSPNTMAKLSNGHLIVEQITDFNHYQWREGLISFRNMEFLTLMKKFEDCYNIRIVVENKRAGDYICTGKFRQSDGIDYALRVLQRDVRFTYTREEEQHIIYIR